MYIYIYIHIRGAAHGHITEPMIIFTSTCPLKVQISQGLGPFFQIELLRTGRSNHPKLVTKRCGM